MPDAQAQDVRTELASLRREVAAYRAMHETRRARRRLARARIIGTALLTLLVTLVPLSLLAAGSFTDLDPNSPHNDNINAIAAAGITKGCNPPDFTQYCPKDNVTREEMASFIARTAGIGGNPPVVNALTAVNATNAANATNAGHATTADSATTAQNATHATTADTAANATNAQPKYVRTIVVSPVGTDTQNGTALLNAIAGITTASASTPYLLKIEPGVYDLGTTPLAMKQYVDIEGSGEGVTTITGNSTTPANQFTNGTIIGSDNAELRELTVQNSATNAYVAGIFNDSVSPRLTQITVKVTAAGGFTKVGIYNSGANAKALIQRVTISVSGGGGNNGITSGSSASPTILYSTISGTANVSSHGLDIGIASATVRSSIITGGQYGIALNGGTAHIDNSRIQGSSQAFLVINNSTLYLATSLLQGSPFFSITNSTVNCIHSYDVNYAAPGAPCTP